MKNFLAIGRSSIPNSMKSIARYYNMPGSGSSFRKPMHPLDNLDPGRENRTMVDEYDKLLLFNSE